MRRIAVSGGIGRLSISDRYRKDCIGTQGAAFGRSIVSPARKERRGRGHALKAGVRLRCRSACCRRMRCLDWR
ncbi:hypothetical protein RHECIAT_CH0003691 [Rhizobium etli CIAT 652]|uniref:Uncharacterized protein n=1 Tax=Rhizobium etli (strain CIAT 652) TaxID=491916 RepID=B3PYW5_RHIE6|nr:hypothetical protein RHECIAT_CH0003691 [Rhizobium etli CIAT 652]KKZ86766.1 hypothetical protein RPHASCH2410_CH16720 [Rhizobium phaseoli Ch24-10]